MNFLYPKSNCQRGRSNRIMISLGLILTFLKRKIKSILHILSFSTLRIADNRDTTSCNNSSGKVWSKERWENFQSLLSYFVTK